MNLSLADSVFSGIATSYSVFKFKQHESSYLAGVNHHLLGVSQALALAGTLSFVDKSLKAINNSSDDQISNLTCNIIVLCPFIINYFNSRIDRKSHPILNQGLNLVTTQTNNVCHLVTVVSAISAVCFNQSALGFSCLASYSVGAAISNNFLGARIANYYDHAGKVCSILRIIKPDSYFSMLISLMSLTSYAFYFLNGNTLANGSGIDLPFERENHIPIEKIPEHTFRELDKDHFRFKAPLPKSSEADPEELLQLFNGFDLKQKENYLYTHRSITNDLHWKSKNSANLTVLKSVEEKIRNSGLPLNEQEQSEQEKLIKYAKTGIHKIINNIMNAKISTGKIHDYGPLQIKLRFITDNIMQETSPIFQFEALLRLAIASYYCAGEYQGAIEDEFKACNIKNEHIQSKFIKLLIDHRISCMNAFIADLERKPGEPLKSGLLNLAYYSPGIFFNFTSWGEYFFGSKAEGVDRHLYDDYVAMLADSFEVSHYCFTDIEITMQNPFKLNLNSLIHNILPQYRALKKDFLAQHYSTKELIKRVNEFDRMHHTLYFDTWKKWYKDDHCNATDEEACKWVQENVYDDMLEKTKGIYARYFLYRMGVFKVTKQLELPALRYLVR